VTSQEKIASLSMMLFSDGMEQFIGGFTTLHATFINLPGFDNDLVGKYSWPGQ
jgi:hypothetical protein